METEIFPPIPPETSKMASAVFGRSNFYITVGDQANQLFSELNLDNSPLPGTTSKRNQAMLYLITIFQITEILPDQFAAQAIRNRVDWKYALHLPVSYPGQDASSFCEFRKWLLAEPSREQKLDTLITRLNEVMEASGSPCISQKNKHALAYICLISRVMEVYETVSQVLETLATLRPELLRAISLPHWYKRYSYQQKNLIPTLERPELEALANAIGMDIYQLLKSISTSELNVLGGQPEIAALKRVWQEQYSYTHGKLTWKNNDCAHCSASFFPDKFL